MAYLTGRVYVGFVFLQPNVVKGFNTAIFCIGTEAKEYIHNATNLRD